MTEFTQEYERLCDEGKACPVCYQRINARRITALGIALFRCPHCSAEWFDLSE